MNRDIVLIAHNLRSCHNVGSLLRTADGIGVKTVYLTGYTPYPLSIHDKRMPHISRKIHNQISKTALGAEDSVRWKQIDLIEPLLDDLKRDGYEVIALEQSPSATPLPKLSVPKKTAIIVGREVEGIEAEVLLLADTHCVIPMYGDKESFNVVQAAAMALYHIRFI